jgi:diadenosine tetraphosphate (Ap4A) HIT family hydrolase
MGIVLCSIKSVIKSDNSFVTGNFSGIISYYAGQTVMHCHCHRIPRYAGDVADPRGGVRSVVPGKKEY